MHARLLLQSDRALSYARSTAGELMLQAADIERLVRAELDGTTDKRLVAAIAPLLVPPRLEERDGDHGPAGQTYPCWIVLEHPASNTGIAYCAEGFGPACDLPPPPGYEVAMMSGRTSRL